jgi:hypothetical protein
MQQKLRQDREEIIVKQIAGWDVYPSAKKL